ncbi:unnamed protein product [Parnassius mnemosyne]|uniref:DUF7041 domain-containing protein n=1 Tax=Parnassius mnemosyne TaxID=213953 RepID=A0AAV1LUG2_9NEOP
MWQDASADASNSSTGDKEAVLCRVGIKMPSFWPEKPTLWFAQLDCQFAVANITSDVTKYYHVISVLDPKIAAEVEDLIIRPPANEKYDTLKRELIARLSASRSEQIKQLLMNEELGDRKPSQFLRHIRSLAGSGLLQTIVAMQDNFPLDQLAQLADKVAEVTPHTSAQQVASTSTSDSSPAFEDLNRKIDALTKRLDEMSTARGRRDFPKRRSKSSSRRRSQSRSRSRADGQRYCWYHFIYGEKAAKCIKPCKYTKN